jgi:hypothetical protein
MNEGLNIWERIDITLYRRTFVNQCSQPGTPPPATPHQPNVSPFALRQGHGGFKASSQPSLAMFSMVRMVHPYEPPLCDVFFIAALIRSRFGWLENTKPLSLSGVYVFIQSQRSQVVMAW